MEKKKQFLLLSKFKKLVLSIMAIILTCSYPCIYMFLSNVDEANSKKAYLPFLVFVFFAIVVMMIGAIFIRDIYKLGVLTSVFMIMFINFNVVLGVLCSLETVINEMVWTIILIVIWIAAMIFIIAKKYDYETINQIIIMVLSGLIIFNVVLAIPKIRSMNKKITLHEVEQYAKNRDNNQNVYYIFVDEYGGTENLKYYFDYDNSKFLNGLEDRGFTISESTYNYDGILTKEILPNMLNLEYVTTADGSHSINAKYLENPVLYRFFRDLGYDINVINQQNMINDEGCNVLYRSPENVVNDVEKDIDFYLLNNSFTKQVLTVISKFVKTKKNYDAYRKDIYDAMDKFVDVNKEVKKKPTFSFCYINVPHRPFVVDKDGKPIADENLAYSWLAKTPYTDQLEYTNKKINECVDNILKTDPESTIIIQSDHGARYPYFCMSEYSKKEYDAEKETAIMQNAINCVYVGGEKLDIEGLNSINTWRHVLNYLYGTDYKDIYPEEKYIYKWRYLSNPL